MNEHKRRNEKSKFKQNRKQTTSNKLKFEKKIDFGILKWTQKSFSAGQKTLGGQLVIWKLAEVRLGWVRLG